MRNFTTRIQNKANALALRARMALSNQRGDFYISDAVKIIIAVVLGALLLAALTLIFNDTVIPRITSEIEGLFGYPGCLRRPAPLLHTAPAAGSVSCTQISGKA